MENIEEGEEGAHPLGLCRAFKCQPLRDIWSLTSNMLTSSEPNATTVMSGRPMTNNSGISSILHACFARQWGNGGRFRSLGGWDKKNKGPSLYLLRRLHDRPGVLQVPWRSARSFRWSVGNQNQREGWWDPVTFQAQRHHGRPGAGNQPPRSASSDGGGDVEPTGPLSDCIKKSFLRFHFWLERIAPDVWSSHKVIVGKILEPYSKCTNKLQNWRTRWADSRHSPATNWCCRSRSREHCKRRKPALSADVDGWKAGED